MGGNKVPAKAQQMYRDAASDPVRMAAVDAERTRLYGAAQVAEEQEERKRNLATLGGAPTGSQHPAADPIRVPPASADARRLGDAGGAILTG